MIEIELTQDHGYHSAGTRRRYDEVSAQALIDAGLARRVADSAEPRDEASKTSRATRVKAADVVTLNEGGDSK